jgi:hypothetical protein
VVAYDHRYIGASAPLPGSPAAAPGAELARQTSELLARDALALVNAVWGPAAAVHVYGCGCCAGMMGGVDQRRPKQQPAWFATETSKKLTTHNTTTQQPTQQQ